jgi:hypothetical protein
MSVAVIARSASDEAMQPSFAALWIASLALAMTGRGFGAGPAKFHSNCTVNNMPAFIIAIKLKGMPYRLVLVVGPPPPANEDL